MYMFRWLVDGGVTNQSDSMIEMHMNWQSLKTMKASLRTTSLGAVENMIKVIVPKKHFKYMYSS